METTQKIIWEPIPQILEITFFEMPASARPTHTRIVKDYEIDFFTSGNGKIFLDDESYDISPMHIMFRRPGQRIHSIPPHSCYALTLNFSSELNRKENYRRQRTGAIQPETDHPCFNILLPYFSIRNDSLYRNIFSRLHSLNMFGTDNSDEKYDTVLTDLFLNLLTDCIYQKNSAAENIHTDMHPAVQKLCEWLNSNLSKKISLSDMGKITNMSPNYLHRLFTKHIGATPNDYLERIRLEQACNLLINTDNLIEWISEQSGFNSVAYFTKRFKMRYGISPANFRKNHKIHSSIG